MLIQLTDSYLGWKSNETFIPAGIYPVGAPALCGIEDYLVNEMKIATYLDPQPVAPPPPPQEPDPDETDLGGYADSPYKDWSINDARAAIKAREIDLDPYKEQATGKNGAFKLADLIGILEADDAREDAEDEPPLPYAERTDDELRAEIEARGITLAEVKGSGEDGALTHDDYVAILEGDDADQELGQE